MIHILRSAVALMAMLPILAFCQTLSNHDVLLELEWGATTMASATMESANSSAMCRRSDRQCAPGAPSLTQLAYEGPGCSQKHAFSWRLANELSDGVSFIKRVKTLADSRKLSDCSGKRCLVVVPTISTKVPESEPGVETLSVCKVELVTARSGPPNSCQEIVKLGKGRQLVKSITANAMVGCSMGMRDFDAVFSSLANDSERIRKTVESILSASPFNLSVEREGDAVLGTTSFASSSVLKGWREWIVVRVDLKTRGDTVGATIATNILVSKQNTTSRESWTPSSDQQEATYLSALKKAFEKQGGNIMSP